MRPNLIGPEKKKEEKNPLLESDMDHEPCWLATTSPR